MVKNLPANAGDTGDIVLILGLGKFPGVENGNPLQYSCLENSTDRGALQAAVHEVTKSWTRLNSHLSLLSARCACCYWVVTASVSLADRAGDRCCTCNLCVYL